MAFPLKSFLQLGGAVLLLLCTSLGYQGSKSSLPVSRIILITVDTLRADHLECYGYTKARSPNFTRLARDGVIFQNAISSVPLTLPSHCSIFTGTYPVTHGVRDQAGFSLSPGSETLASRLRAQGLTTGAFVGSFVLDSRFGLGQGFDTYYDRFDSTRFKSGNPEGLERKAEVVAREAIRWMEAQSQRGFFAWLHFYDPHTPYAAPEPFRSQYASSPYDGEIAYTDSVLGGVLDYLVRKAWYDGALVLLTSDHGEDLGEHGENTHGYFLYDATLRVPLLIKFPHRNYAGKVLKSQVRIIDIMPTILQVLGSPTGSSIQGRELLSLLASEAPPPPEEAYGETFYPYYHFGWSPLLCIRKGKFKYIDAPQPELYDLEVDPKERNNILKKNRTTAAKFRERLLGTYIRMERTPSTKRTEVDLPTQEKLKSLGYLASSSRAARSGARKNLPDPKDKLNIYNLLQSALLEGQKEQPEGAIRKLEAILALEPGLTDAHIHLGLQYKKIRNYSQAVEEFKAALKIDSSNAVATYNLAHSFASWGKLPEAILGFQRTLALDPKEARAHVGLGIAYQTQGDFDQAIREYQSALKIDPYDSTAHNNLGSVYLTRREVEKAMHELRRALEINNRSAETHNLMGSAHWLNNELEPAIAEFQESIRLDRRYLDAYLNLGLLLGNQNRNEDALRYLKTATELAPQSPKVFQILGQTYRAAGMKSEADEAFSRAKELARR